MELNCANVVKMTCQSEEALLSLVVPNLDLMIVTTTDEKWLSFMKTDAPNRTYI